MFHACIFDLVQQLFDRLVFVSEKVFKDDEVVLVEWRACIKVFLSAVVVMVVTAKDSW